MRRGGPVSAASEVLLDGCAALDEIDFCWSAKLRAPSGSSEDDCSGRLKPYGCRLVAVRRSVWGDPASAAAEALLDERGAWAEMPRLAAMADVIVLACVQVFLS